MYDIRYVFCCLFRFVIYYLCVMTLSIKYSLTKKPENSHINKIYFRESHMPFDLHQHLPKMDIRIN